MSVPLVIKLLLSYVTLQLELVHIDISVNKKIKANMISKIRENTYDSEYEKQCERKYQ